LAKATSNPPSPENKNRSLVLGHETKSLRTLTNFTAIYVAL